MFADRRDAARQLAEALKKYENEEDAVILAIPRGGVVLGEEIAKTLNLPLEVELIKKIGHPQNSELAIGAVSLNSRIITGYGDVSRSYTEEETQRIRDLIKERFKRYSREPVDVSGKIAILVDDGIATGSTMEVTIELVRESSPKKVVVAVPVAPPRTVRKLEDKVDEMVCLETPSDFFAIGQFYEKFEQVPDDEVVDLLKGTKHLASEK